MTNRLSYFPEVGRVGLAAIKNQNQVFRMLDFNEEANQLAAGMERSSKLKKCFAHGICTLKVRVLKNDYWNIIGGWTIWTQFVLQHPDTTLVNEFKDIMPDNFVEKSQW